MPPMGKPGEPRQLLHPKLQFNMLYTPDEMAHVFMSIANYQAYRDQDPDPVVHVLSNTHPLIRIQNQIIGQLDDLIATGIMNGWEISGLLEIKEVLAGAAQAAQEMEGDGDAD